MKDSQSQPTLKEKTEEDEWMDSGENGKKIQAGLTRQSKWKLGKKRNWPAMDLSFTIHRFGSLHKS